MPYDPTRAGIIGINRIIPFTAAEVGDEAVGASANVQQFINARRKFRGNVPTAVIRDALTGLQAGEWVLVEATPTGPRIDMWNGTTWVSLTSAAPAPIGLTVITATVSPHIAEPATLIACRSAVAQPFNIRLPAGATNGAQVTVKDAKGDADTRPITVSTTDGSPIDGQSTLVLNEAYASRTFVYGSNEWLVT